MFLQGGAGRWLPLAGIDVVEVAPPYDHAEITALLAGRVVLEALAGIAWRRRRAAGQPVRWPGDPLLSGRGGTGPGSEQAGDEQG